MSRLIHILCLSVVIFSPAPSLSAQELPWNSLSAVDFLHPFSPLAYRPAVIPDPADLSGESWYAFTPGYLWHTEDMGVTVHAVPQTGLDNLMISALAVAHDVPSILYVATGVNRYHRGNSINPSREVTRFEGNGVYRSLDRGETWERLPFFAGVSSGRDLRILKSIGTSAMGDTVLVTTTHRILRSTDAGQSWAVVKDLPRLTFEPELQSDHSIAHARIYHHPLSLRHIFVTVAHNEFRSHTHSYVLASHDGGETWDFLQVDAHFPTNTSAQELEWQFAADPKDPNVFWAQVSNTAYNVGRKIFRSSDGGQTWTEVPVVQKEGAMNLPRTFRAQSMHVHPQGGDTLVLGWSIGHYQNGNLVAEGIQGGTPIHYLIPAPTTYYRFRYVEDSPGIQMGIAHAWMVASTIDESLAADVIHTGELPWFPYFGDICTSSLPTGADPAHRYVAADYDKFNAWRVQRRDAPGPRPSPSPPTRFAGDLPLVPGQTRAYFPKTYALWDYPYSHPRLHCHPDRYDILEGGEHSWGGSETGWSHGGRIQHPDSGWSSIADPAPFPDLHRLSFSQKRPDRVWVVSRDELFRSDDYTETFMEVNLREHISALSSKFQTVHAHDANADVVYTDWTVSKDGGQTWTERDIPPSRRIQKWDRVVSHPSDPSVIFSCALSGVREWRDYLQLTSTLADAVEYGSCRDLFVFPNNPDRMWMGTDTGLWESMDAGMSWSRKNRGLPNVPVTRINLSHDREEILVATFGRGLFTVPAISVGIILVSTSPDTEIPESSMLLTNYPNPFASETTLEFTTEGPAHVRMDVFDVLGRRVAIATDQLYGGGFHQVRWDGSSLPSGVYLVRMEADGREVGAQNMMKW